MCHVHAHQLGSAFTIFLAPGNFHSAKRQLQEGPRLSQENVECQHLPLLWSPVCKSWPGSWGGRSSDGQSWIEVFQLKGGGPLGTLGLRWINPAVICQTFTHSSYFLNSLSLAKCMSLSPFSRHFYTHVTFKGNLICMFLIHSSLTQHNCSASSALRPRIFLNLSLFFFK